MAYTEFSLSDLTEKFGVKHERTPLLFPLHLIEPSERLKLELEESTEMPIKSEKARSEWIVVPILKELRNFNASGILYGVIAGMEAWKNAGLTIKMEDIPDWDSGTIFGTGTSGIDKFRESIYKIDDLQTRRLGSTAVAQTMNSGISAYLGGKLGLGNQVSTNSSACTTGAESILMGFERIQSGLAKRMLVGSTSDSGPYIWGGFDPMKVCTLNIMIPQKMAQDLCRHPLRVLCLAAGPEH